MNEETRFDGLLRFEVASAFDPHFVCTLVQYHEPPDRYGLRCKLGGYAEEAGSWENPVPRHVVEQIFSELAAIRLVLAPDFGMGLDGTHYDLTVTRGWNSLVLHWWARSPSQWKEIVPILRRIVALAGPRAAGVQIE